MNNGKNLIGSFVKIVLSIILIFVVFAGAGVFAYSKMHKPAEDEPSVNVGETNLLDALSGKDISTNVVIYGVDADEVRTDVIFVVHYDSKTEKVSILSVPRDTHVKINSEMLSYMKENGRYVPYDGIGQYGYCKINEIYAYAGTEKAEEFAVKQLEDLLGIKIDNFVLVNFDAFKEIVDMVGGVDMYVPQDMHWDMRDTGDILIDLEEGYQHLDGEQAEQLVRFRRYPQGDVARVQVQQTFIKALAEKVLSSNTIIKNMPTLIKTAYEYVKTDFTLTDMLKYANYIDKIDKNSITMQTLAGVGENLGGVSYYTYYKDEIGDTVDRFLRGTTEEIENGEAEVAEGSSDSSSSSSASSSEIKEISSVGKNIAVANGGNTNGLAGKNQTMLEKDGFTVTRIYTYTGEKTEETRIYVTEEGMGSDLQKYFEASEIIVDSTMIRSGEDILIILGMGE